MTDEEYEAIIARFMKAVRNGDHSTAEDMILHEDDEDSSFLNLTVYEWEPPLKIAVSNNDTKMVDILLDYAADYNTDSYTRDHALYDATKLGSKELVECILLHEPDEKLQHDGWTCLLMAVVESHPNIVQLLANDEVMDIGYKGWYPLNLALEQDDLDSAKILIQRCSLFTCDIQDYNGDTPLHIASKKGLDEIVSLLLENVIDINRKDIYGNTALHLATRNNHISVVKLLLGDSEIKYELLNNNNETPKMIAETNGYSDILDIFNFLTCDPIKEPAGD